MRMHVGQKRVLPRTKDWVPLVSQQFRLRNLYQILGVNIKLKDNILGYYYTIHATYMSAPFYTSDTILSNCPKWKEIECPFWESQSAVAANKAFVLRLWSKTENNCNVEAVWGIHLNGLSYIGQHLSRDLLEFPSPSLLFLLPGGYFTDRKSMVEPQAISFQTFTDNIRRSYSVTKLKDIQEVQRRIKENSEATEHLKGKISSGQYDFADTRGGRRMLHRFLTKNKQKRSIEDSAKAWEAVEIARFRVALLKHERQLAFERLAKLNAEVDQLADRNQCQESVTLEQYRLLHRETLLLRRHTQQLPVHREQQLHQRVALQLRVKQLITEMRWIYPIECGEGGKWTVCGVHLPHAEDYHGWDAVQLAVALGYVGHFVAMVAKFMQVPLIYPITHFGSRSRITDPITDSLTEKDRDFPLFYAGRDRPQHFQYAVYLLNMDIAQLRALSGLPTHDLRQTLPNLGGLQGDFRDLGQAKVLTPWETNPPVRPFLISSCLSYSLDKGLNELEEINRNKTDLKAKVPASCRNSESSLLILPSHSPKNERTKLKDQSKEVFDEDRSRTQSCITISCPEPEVNKIVEAESKIDENEHSPGEIFVEDSVSQRTETLMNETGSFNMFRSRFSSVLRPSSP